MKWLMLLCLSFGCISCALAQNTPLTATTQKKRLVIVPGRFEIRDDAGVLAPALVSGPLGIYVFNKGVLARFDAKTLQPQGVVELYGKLEELPDDAQALWQSFEARGQRLLPAGMALHGGDLLILSGDRFFRVDPATLAIKQNSSLLADDKQPGMRVDDFLFGPAPRMEFSGDILYRVHASMFNAPLLLAAIDSNTGKVLAEKPLPTELTMDDWQNIRDGLTFDYNYAPRQSPLQLTAAPDAVYVLRYGGLAKLDPKTLEPVKVKQLFGPVVNVADDASAETKAAASIDRAQRTLSPVLLLQGKELLIISGDSFFRVNADTLEISKQTQFTQVADDARAKRMGQLLSYGQPQVLTTTHGLLLTRGKECLLLNPREGTARALSLPEPLTRPLPFLRKREQLFKPYVPKDGDTIELHGVAWSKTEGDNITWLFYDENIGTVKLTGAKIDAISNDQNNQQGEIMVQGIFHKLADGGPEKLVGTVDTLDNANAFMMMNIFPCNGTIHQRKVGDATIWTISGASEGSEYVLVGDKVKALTALPNIDGQAVNIIGHFSREYEKMPKYGQGYLDMQSYNVQQTPESTADKQDQANSALAAAVGESFFVIRNGAIAQFDAAALKQLAVRDLLPPAPEISKDTAITDDLINAIGANRAQRLATPLLIPQGNDLGVLLGNSYALLDGASLMIKAQQAQGNAPLVSQAQFSNGIPNYLIDGSSLFTLNGKNLLRFDLTGGNTATTVPLPEKMVSKIYPSRN